MSCTIDDSVLGFEMEAIAGSSGPIMQVNVGKLSVKPAAQFEMAAPDVSFDRSHLVQQWIVGNDLRLQIAIDGKLQNVDLKLTALFDKRKDKYFGNYVLTLGHGGKSKTLKGRIKDCEIG